MKVSFDFDGTLSEQHVQDFARELIAQGVDVWVVTTRWDENHKHRYGFNPTIDDLWEVVDSLGIPRWKVRFTCMKYKHEYLDGTSFIWHLDDNPEEFSKARVHGCSVPMIQVESGLWKSKCERLLNEAKEKQNEESVHNHVRDIRSSGGL